MNEDSRSARARPRVALIGNPSDGYGGAVIATTFDAFGAEVRIGPGEGEPARLVSAAAEMIRRHGCETPEPLRATITSDIPREVGLAGSSAIVIAALRALAPEPLDPDLLAQLALAAEVEVLGLAAGPQDRLVQAHGGLVFMDFAAGYGFGRAERLDASLLPPLFVAWRPASAESSDVPHSDLRGRWERGDRKVHDAIAELRRIAFDARDALLVGEPIGALIDRGHDLRAGLMTLRPEHVEMVDLAREHGASAQFAGSGGSIVGTIPPGDAMARLEHALAQLGCGVIALC